MEDSHEEENMISMKQLNQTFSNFSENNITKNIFGEEIDSNASHIRTFGKIV